MIRGKPGSGKSTAIKRACEIASKAIGQDEAVVAFFFNSRGAQIEKKLEGFFRSILHQLMRNQGPTNNDIFRRWQQTQSHTAPGWMWSLSELQNMFQETVCRSIKNLTMFVDALDECEPIDAAYDLFDLLTNIGACHVSGRLRLKICVSCRPYPSIGALSPSQIQVEGMNEVDIRKYVGTVLEPWCRSLGQTESWKLDLSHRIARRSGGMFLWAVFVLRRIRVDIENRVPHTELLTTIDDTPHLLKELYQKLMDGMSANEREHCNLILAWVLFARRPLSLSELSHALAFREERPVPQQSEASDESTSLEYLRTLIAHRTRGLVEVVEVKEWYLIGSKHESTSRVQCIHETVRQYIIENRHVITAGLGSSWAKPGFTDHVLATTCYHYIRGLCVDTQAVDAVSTRMRNGGFTPGQLSVTHTEEQPLLEYVLQHWFDHAEQAHRHGLPQQYLRDLSANTTSDHEPLWWTSFTALFRLYWKHGYHYKTLGSAKHWSEYTISQLAFACAYNLDSWIEYLLESSRREFSVLELSRALCVTAALGSQTTVSSLIAKGADIDHEEPLGGNPLYLSLMHKQDTIFETLMAHGATVAMGQREYSPLDAAVAHHPLNTVLLLLKHCAGINPGAHGNNTRSDDAVTRSAAPKTGTLEVATRREIEFLNTVLPLAQRDRVPVGSYKAAYVSALRYSGNLHAEALKSAITALFPGQERVYFHVEVTLFSGKYVTMEVWEEMTISELQRDVEDRGANYGFKVMITRSSCGKLHEDKTLQDHNVRPGSLLISLPKVKWGGDRMPGG